MSDRWGIDYNCDGDVSWTESQLTYNAIRAVINSNNHDSSCDYSDDYSDGYADGYSAGCSDDFLEFSSSFVLCKAWFISLPPLPRICKCPRDTFP